MKIYKDSKNKEMKKIYMRTVVFIYLLILSFTILTLKIEKYSLQIIRCSIHIYHYNYIILIFS